jgi:hypothetical protein
MPYLTQPLHAARKFLDSQLQLQRMQLSGVQREVLGLLEVCEVRYELRAVILHQ